MSAPSHASLLAAKLGAAAQHHRAGRFAEAAALYTEVLEAAPASVDALHYLGLLHHQDEAVEHLRAAIALRPAEPTFHNNLGNALVARGEAAEAEAAYRRAIALKPDYANAHNNLGKLLRRGGRIEEAVAALERALALDPRSEGASNHLGLALQSQGRFDEARPCFERAVALAPRSANPWTNLGNLAKESGDAVQAIKHYRHALALAPGRAEVHSNLILALHHLSDDPAPIAAELGRWNEKFGGPRRAAAAVPHRNDRAPDRRLKIGYVSPDFRAHAMARFLRPLFAHHDREAFEIVGYSNTRPTDEITAELKSGCSTWRDIVGRGEEEVADLIRADRIDILVDLASHTARNSLLVFARKPAPVQATYLSYPGNTGLEAMDYRVTDVHLDPPAEDAAGPERPLRLADTYWCYQPPLRPAPPVSPLPATRAGRVTFGCLNNFSKVSPVVLETWSRILRDVPNSQLLLYAPPGSHRSRTLEIFTRHGVEPDRVAFVGRVADAQYLQQYEAIDLALDPFPYPGGTTTCDALWMGVPVISLAGALPLTRGGLTILSNVGLPDLVSHSVADYVDKAVRLARDPARLAALRAALRPRMEASPLMDAPRFARALEAAYRRIWRTWCASGGQTSAGQPNFSAIPSA
jgi:protein O-GlcNAc transferase